LSKKLSPQEKPSLRRGLVYKSARISPKTVVELGDDAWIGDFVFVNLEKLTLGRGSQVNAFASLTGGGKVEIGDYSVIGYGVRLISGTDTPEGRYMADRAPPQDRKIVRGTVRIGNNCFIGANSIISVSLKNPNIHVEDNVVVGALSFVDKSVPARTIGWGAPFRARKERRTVI
jgi:acetyltransferase-like isoleucine patch superfamily enzyme